MKRLVLEDNAEIAAAPELMKAKRRVSIQKEVFMTKHEDRVYTTRMSENINHGGVLNVPLPQSMDLCL